MKEKNSKTKDNQHPSAKEVNYLLPYLSEHFWEVVDISGAQGLRLETLRLQQILGNIRCVDEHAVQWALFVSVCLEHDLETKDRVTF